MYLILRADILLSDYLASPALINGTRDNQYIDISTHEADETPYVTVHRKLGPGEDYLGIVGQEFQQAFAFSLYESPTFNDHPDEGFIVDGTTHFVGIVGYNREFDFFYVTAPGLPSYEIMPGNTVLSPDTRVPYFICPETTGSGGPTRGDEILTLAQIKELATGRLTSPRNDKGGAPQPDHP